MSGREYDNRNSGIISPNERQREGKKDPQWTGTWTDANGVDWWISGWEGQGRYGPYISLKLGARKEPKGTGGYQQPRQDSMSYGRTAQGNHYPPPNNPPPANPRGQQFVTCVDPRDGSHFQATFADAQANNWEVVTHGAR